MLGEGGDAAEEEEEEEEDGAAEEGRREARVFRETAAARGVGEEGVSLLAAPTPERCGLECLDDEAALLRGETDAPLPKLKNRSPRKTALPVGEAARHCTDSPRQTAKAEGTAKRREEKKPRTPLTSTLGKSALGRDIFGARLGSL